jgi:hypothetical protein
VFGEGVSAVKKPLPLFPIVVGAMVALFALVVAIAYVLNLGDQVREDRQPSVLRELEFQCWANGDIWLPDDAVCLKKPQAQQGLTEYDKQKILRQAQEEAKRTACEAAGGRWLGISCSMPETSTPIQPFSEWRTDFCSRYPTAMGCSGGG